jgi:hypothetical protein
LSQKISPILFAPSQPPVGSPAGNDVVTGFSPLSGITSAASEVRPFVQVPTATPEQLSSLLNVGSRVDQTPSQFSTTSTSTSTSTSTGTAAGVLSGNLQIPFAPPSVGAMQVTYEPQMVSVSPLFPDNRLKALDTIFGTNDPSV